jgi:thiamine biosynthesis protein ThiS
MQITLNNRTEVIDFDELSLNQLINYKNYTFKLLVTKVNHQLVKRDERDKVMIKNGDHVEVLHLISGG